MQACWFGDVFEIIKKISWYLLCLYIYRRSQLLQHLKIMIRIKQRESEQTIHYAYADGLFFYVSFLFLFSLIDMYDTSTSSGKKKK